MIRKYSGIADISLYLCFISQCTGSLLLVYPNSNAQVFQKRALELRQKD